jgi:hypothetical protein
MDAEKNSKFHDKVGRVVELTYNHRPKFFNAHLRRKLQVLLESYQQIAFHLDLLLLGHKYQ